GLEHPSSAPNSISVTVSCRMSRTVPRTMPCTISRTTFFSTHHYRCMACLREYRFECGLCFLRQVVGFSVVRELMRNHVGLEGQYGFRNQRGGVSVAANEFRRMSKRQVDQVVEDKHLPIAIRPGADA